MNLFCERLGLSYPIIQAPMAGVSTPALAVAVSEAGALGSLAAAALPQPESLAQQLAALAAATDRPINVNLFCHEPSPADSAHDAQWLAYLAPFFTALHSTPPTQLQESYLSLRTNDALLAVLVQARPHVISFHFGLPTAVQLAALRQTGAVLLACVTSPAEARAAEAAGIDMLVAQGVEAGGHRGTFDPSVEPNIATLDLTRQVVQHSRLPVIAAGGLMDGADLAAVMRAGAVAGQWLGNSALPLRPAPNPLLPRLTERHCCTDRRFPPCSRPLSPAGRHGAW